MEVDIIGLVNGDDLIKNNLSFNEYNDKIKELYQEQIHQKIRSFLK